MKSYIACCLLLFSFSTNAEGFISGTRVKTPTGYSEIQDIKIGDWVLSCDFKNHCVEKEVTHTFQKQASGFLEIHIGHSVIGVDEDNLFYSPQTASWISARVLSQSIHLMNSDYQSRAVKEIRYISQEVVLYTLTVAENHNFYVSHEDILVHNFLVMVPVLAWGAGGLVFGPAAPAVWAIGAVATIIGGIAISEIAKKSNSPYNGFDNTYTESRRHDNHHKPDGRAEGDHTTFRPGPSGGVKDGHYETWKDKGDSRHPKDPHRWESEKRYDGSGKPHGGIPTPHVKDGRRKNVNPARPEEVPYK